MKGEYSKNTSPVDWYLGTYLCRFIEIGNKKNTNLDSRFPAWENTVIVRAKDLKQAYEKVEFIGKEHSEPYMNVEKENVQWEYLGITDLVPIYEELEDGAEIAWTSHNPKKLKNLKGYTKELAELYE